MKKILTTGLVLIMVGFFVNAQEIIETPAAQVKYKKEKKEKFLLPEKGDLAIGVDVIPLFRSLGTIFWGGKDPMGFQGTPYFSGMPYPNISLMAKYMILKNCGIKLNLGVNILSITKGYSVQDDVAVFANPLSEAIVTDYRKTEMYGLSIAVGSEYRLGKKRIVGIFGGDLLFGYYSGSIKYTYGNTMNENNPIPSISPLLDDGYFFTSTSPNTRVLSFKNDGAIAAGAQLTTGLELFIVPKIALGGQVNLSYVFVYNRQTHRKAEGFNELSGKVEKRSDIQNSEGWSHKFNTNNLGGLLYFIFYF